MRYATKRPAETPPTPEPSATPTTQHNGTDLGSYLEHDQLVADTDRPVPRAQLTRRVSTALWILRVFTILVGAMVIYVFFSQLGALGSLCRGRAKPHGLRHAGIRRRLMEPLVQGAVLGHQSGAAAPGRLFLGHEGARGNDQPGN
jgi:hypothetical protein